MVAHRRARSGACLRFLMVVSISHACSADKTTLLPRRWATLLEVYMTCILTGQVACVVTPNRLINESFQDFENSSPNRKECSKFFTLELRMWDSDLRSHKSVCITIDFCSVVQPNPAQQEGGSQRTGRHTSRLGYTSPPSTSKFRTKTYKLKER
jgi:hypothetical protein